MQNTEADNTPVGKVPVKDQWVVIGILLDRCKNRVLAAWRPKDKHMGGRWEFPGGKQENGEDTKQTLGRELKEELDIEVKRSRRFKCFRYSYPDRTLTIEVRIVDDWSGTPEVSENDRVEWVSVQDLNNMEFPAANNEFIKLLSLPAFYFITPDIDVYDKRFLDSVDALLQSGVKMMRFRSGNLGGRKRIKYAMYMIESCRKNNCLFLYDGSPDEVVQLGADGMHMNSVQLLNSPERPLSKDFYVAVSCHNAAEIRKASEISADFCVLAPVNFQP